MADQGASRKVSRRSAREQRALDAARARRDEGDPLPFMMILKQERDRLGIILPVEKSKRPVRTIKSGLL